MTSSGYRLLWDQVVLVMSIKPAQRRSIDDVARRLDRHRDAVGVVMIELARLGLMHQLAPLMNSEYVLTSAGSARRNECCRERPYPDRIGA